MMLSSASRSVDAHGSVWQNALRRTRSGAFGIESAVAWDDLAEHARERLLPLSGLLAEIPAVRVDSRGAQALRHGRDLGPELVMNGFPEAPPPRLRILDESGGRLLALAISRRREHLADATGAGLTRNPIALANALEKIEAAVAPTPAIKRGSAHLCIADPLGRRIDLREGIWADLWATHPPMAKRIAALRTMAYEPR